MKYLTFLINEYEIVLWPVYKVINSIIVTLIIDVNKKGFIPIKYRKES